MRLLHYADLENAADHPDLVAQLAGLIRTRRDDATVVTGGGDNTAPGVLSLASDGRHALDVFDRIRPDLDTLGNHDFDNGLDAIRHVVRASPQTWVCANLCLDGERFGADAGVVPWTVIERAGERLGVFGVATPTTPDITPPAAPLTALDPIETAADAVQDLRGEGVDWIVVLSHLGSADDRLARAVEVDAVLGGHTHEPRIDRIDGTLLARPGANADGVVDLRLDDPLSATILDPGAFPVDDVLAARLRERKAETGLAEVVTTLDAPIVRNRESIRTGTSPLGWQIADSYRWFTDADVGLQNAGGVRDGPPLSNEVTAADLVGVVPYEEPVAVAELSGSDLREVLAGLTGNGNPASGDAAWRGFPSGVSVTWDGHRIGSVEVGGTPLEPDATYRLATSEYLFRTPHEFPSLTGRDPVERTDRPQYDVVVDYARDVGLGSARAPTVRSE